jgi:hypothetical protein
MITHNNWLKSNIIEATLNKDPVNFKAWFEPHPFKELLFREAAIYTAGKIARDFKGRELFVALSGGADSEYMIRMFHAAGVRFTPIVTQTRANYYELQYAVRLSQELKLHPIVIPLEDSDIENYFKEVIYKQLHSKSLNSAYALIATAKVNAVNGVIITGDNLISDNGHLVSDAFEYFADVLYKDNVGFYYYTQELCYAMVKEMKEGESCPDFKARVYGTVWRPKFYPMYSEDMMTRCIDLEPYNRGSEIYDHGSVTGWLHMMEKHLV